MGAGKGGLGGKKAGGRGRNERLEESLGEKGQRLRWR